MKTGDFLNFGHNEELPPLNPKEFSFTVFVRINDIWANQPSIDSECLKHKIKGKNLSICYVAKKNGKHILIDGHHTVIAKKLNGRQKVRVKFIDLDLNPLTTKQP